MTLEEVYNHCKTKCACNHDCTFFQSEDIYAMEACVTQEPEEPYIDETDMTPYDDMNV
jgi:hypothetical protein